MRLVLPLCLALVVLGCTVEATGNLPAAPSAEPTGIGGTVLETIDAPGYTYVRLETSNGEAWAAVPQAAIAVGSKVVIANPEVMSDFESKTLGRVFDKIYFGTLGGGSAAPAGEGSDAHGAMHGAMGGGESAAESDSGPIEVRKAEGANGRTVAELYAESGELSGKSVALRGKVVKYTAGIMGRNWIHLQDGTGDAAAGTHDLTVTTSATTAVGEIVLVEGTVAVDKDFGAGYRYAVIVEEASLK